MVFFICRTRRRTATALQEVPRVTYTATFARRVFASSVCTLRIRWCMITADFVCVTSMHATRLCKNNHRKMDSLPKMNPTDAVLKACDWPTTSEGISARLANTGCCNWWPAGGKLSHTIGVCKPLRESRCLPVDFHHFFNPMFRSVPRRRRPECLHKSHLPGA
jgi:hypothetical protein